MVDIPNDLDDLWTLDIKKSHTFRETVHTVAVVTRRIICIVPALAVPTVIVPARILVVILVVILAPILIILAPILIIPPPILITPTLATPITQPNPLKSMPFMTES